MKITDGGFVTIIGGLIIMFGCCGMPGGVNPNDKTVMINPPGAYHNGGVNENLTPEFKMQHKVARRLAAQAANLTTLEITRNHPPSHVN